MRLIDRIGDRYRQQGYFEGMASGASVVYSYGVDSKQEKAATDLIARAQQAYETNGIVWACVLTRMMLLSEATFKLREKKTKKLYGNEDVLKGRRIDLSLLEFPWPGATTGELWARMEQDLSLAGNAYIVKVEDDELLQLPPREVTIISEEVVSSGGVRYKRPIGYDWDPEFNNPDRKRSPKAQFLRIAEVAHWSPYPDPGARVRGMSWLTPVMREIYADSAMTTYKSTYLDHGTPITAVKYPLKMKRETIDMIVERIGEKYGGAANVGKTLVFDQGADPILGNGLKDLDYAAVQAVGEVRICADSGVPPVLMGLKSAEDQSTYQTELRRFADITCRPLWRSGCAALQKLVSNVPTTAQLWHDTSDIAALQAAETERAQVMQVESAALLTLNQAGYTRDSAVAFLASGDISQLVPDPNAPTPGVQERETIAVKEDSGVPVTGPESGGNANKTTVSPTRPAVTGNPPGGGQTLTKPQTDASKMPMPGSFPKMPANGKAKG